MVGASFRVRARGTVGGLRRWWQSPNSLVPRLKLSAKAALAAGLAWQLAELFPSQVDRYAYYAALGAVLAMYPSIVSSVQAAAQTALGVGLGALIAFVVDAFLTTSSAAVALVVGAGMLAGIVRWLGDQRSWVPITALFVFTLADPSSPSYAVGYVGLTLVGVVVGTVVNFLVFPPLHLRASRRALQALQDIVVDQLQALAEGLERNEAPDPQDWEQRTRAVTPTVSTMREAVGDLARSTRGNPRARRYRQDTARQQRHGQAFERMALLVEDLVNVLAEVEQEDVPALPFDDKVRLAAARAIRNLAELAAYWGDVEGDVHEVDEEMHARIAAACTSLEGLEDSVTADPGAGGSDPFVAGSVVTTLRRCLGAMVVCGGSTALARHRSKLFR